jgi:hypothetical protein
MPASALLVPRSRNFHSQLLQVFEALPGTIGGVPASAFWSSLTRLQLDTGEPIDSVARLHWWQLDLDRHLLTIPRGNLDLTLSRATVAALRTIEEPQRQPVFPWPGGAAALHRALNYLTAQAAVLASKGGDHHDA